jgi:hypothetical protein
VISWHPRTVTRRGPITLSAVAMSIAVIRSREWEQWRVLMTYAFASTVQSHAEMGPALHFT